VKAFSILLLDPFLSIRVLYAVTTSGLKPTCTTSVHKAVFLCCINLTYADRLKLSRHLRLDLVCAYKVISVIIEQVSPLSLLLPVLTVLHIDITSNV